MATNMPGDPPADAINASAIGIAIVVVLPAGQTLADGRLSVKLTAGDIAGVSSRYSVIWRAASFQPAGFWLSSFPPSYACGLCTPKPDGGSFEGFAPTSCDQIRITPYGTEKTCNWS